MKYTLRTLLCLLLALCTTLPMVSCDGGNWRDDLTAAQIEFPGKCKRAFVG